MSLLDLSLPNIDSTLFDPPTAARLPGTGTSTHAPRFLLLHGSLRERSYIKLLTLEAARLLIAMGGDVRVFDPAGLPLPDAAPESHPKVQKLRDAAAWVGHGPDFSRAPQRDDRDHEGPDRLDSAQRRRCADDTGQDPTQRLASRWHR